MTLAAQIAALPRNEWFKLVIYQEAHGARVRRTEAMRLLGVTSPKIFKKMVDAVPHMAHRMPGEEQDKYLTAAIWLLLPAPARCATRGEEPINEYRLPPARRHPEPSGST